MKTTGEIIRKKRQAKGLLLRELAAKLKVDSAVLSKIERGERKAKKEQIIQIAEILEMNKRELTVAWLSDKIFYEISDEEFGYEALQLAEQKVKHFKSRKL